MSKERIYLDTKKESMTADGLSAVVPDGHPSYHFFLFKHTFEGDYQESIGTHTYVVWWSLCTLCYPGIVMLY